MAGGRVLLTGATDGEPGPDPITAPPPPPIPKKVKVYLDPGHHAGITGNRSPVKEDGSCFYEWESNWRWAKDIEAAANAAGFETLITFPNPHGHDNRAETIQQFRSRVEAVMRDDTKLVKVFLSLHSNADGSTGVDEWGTAYGLEIFVDQSATPSVKRAAIAMTKALLSAFGNDTRDRTFKTGYKNNRRLFVLRALQHIAIAMLIEFEFHDSKIGLSRLEDPNWRRRGVAGVINGLEAINNLV